MNAALIIAEAAAPHTLIQQPSILKLLHFIVVFPERNGRLRLLEDLSPALFCCAVLIASIPFMTAVVY